jgi:hypothetical protein
MRRRDLIVSLVSAALWMHGVMPERRAVAAGLGFAWTKVPAITVIGAAGDPRQPLTRDAVVFWNDTLAGLGSGFRLGAITRGPESVPDAVIAGMSQNMLSGRKPGFPPELASIPGDIVVALSNADFISFSPHWADGKGLVAIKSGQAYPMTVPNVARNVLAHEFGHAIGLAHNADPSKLMCGRPAPCRPMEFQSTTEHYFPLTESEKTLLLQLCPSDWRAHQTRDGAMGLANWKGGMGRHCCRDARRSAAGRFSRSTHDRRTAGFGATSSLPGALAKVFRNPICRPSLSCVAGPRFIEFTTYALASRPRPSWMEPSGTRTSRTPSQKSRYDGHGNTIFLPNGTP